MDKMCVKLMLAVNKVTSRMGGSSSKAPNWNCISRVYPRSLRWAAIALFMGGGPHRNIWMSEAGAGAVG